MSVVCPCEDAWACWVHRGSLLVFCSTSRTGHAGRIGLSRLFGSSFSRSKKIPSCEFLCLKNRAS